ncbi:MAG TPA: hypothetical protein VF520_10070 [Thermoleophilaceae bacterium]|jgi:hypothetical protein
MSQLAVRRSTFEGISPRNLWLGLAVIVGAPAFAAAAGYEYEWSAGTTAFVALTPMWIAITLQVLSLSRTYGAWIAFFGIVTLPQLGHFGEHLGQMAQIHTLDAAPKQAHGAVGALDIEWVHFIWNLWVLVGVMVLVMKFRSNPWLWATVAIGAWHMAEHVSIMLAFWDTGKPGDPGLLAKGGDIGGGINLLRPDLHFIYNLLMTAPLVAAMVHQLRRERERT